MQSLHLQVSNITKNYLRLEKKILEKLKAEETKSAAAEIKHILYFNKVLLYLLIIGTVLADSLFAHLHIRFTTTKL